MQHHYHTVMMRLRMPPYKDKLLGTFQKQEVGIKFRAELTALRLAVARETLGAMTE